MTEQSWRPIVTATSTFSQSFSSCFRTFIPPVATYRPYSGVHVDERLLEQAKLVIFTGGEDINPAIYGQLNKHSAFNPERDTAEIQVLRYCLKNNVKMLGICRGHQLINAYLGGLLVQDIQHELNVVHEGEHGLEMLDEGGIVPNLFTGTVNSLHHQGVVKPGEGLSPTTYWQGVFESTENEHIMSVQFHPEWMDSPDNVLGINLWQAMVSWAKLEMDAKELGVT